MSGTAELEREILRMMREIDALEAENAGLRVQLSVENEKKLQTCRGCTRLKEDYTGTFHMCQRLGSVNPDRDGCTRRETKCQ